jgi:hypothetical protein
MKTGSLLRAQTRNYPPSAGRRVVTSAGSRADDSTGSDLTVNESPVIRQVNLLRDLKITLRHNFLSAIPCLSAENKQETADIVNIAASQNASREKCASCGARTHDRRIKSPMLYQLS